jgi:hypothetical protein
MTTIYRSRQFTSQEFLSAQAAEAFDDGVQTFYWGQDCPADEAQARGWRFASLMDERTRQDRRDAALGDLYSERYL